MGLLSYLNVPSWSDIRSALTLRNVGKFFVSPLMAALVYFFLGLYCNSVLQIVADRQTMHCGEERCPPLPDLGHQAFPHLSFVRICDYWLYIAVASTVLRFSPLFVNYSLSLVMLRRWFFLQGTLFWMRGISIALTRQSVPQEDCVVTATGEAWIEGFYIMVGVHVTCGDIMFSGHTAGISLCVLLWTHYSKGEEWKICCGENRPFLTPNLDAVGDPATCSLTAVLAWVYATVGFFFIIATHFHYSNDVFIGLLLTQFVFRVYHYYIKTVLEQPGWWAALFRWFEGFDTALLQQIRQGKHGETRRSLLDTHRSALNDSEESDAAAAADHNAGHQNESEAVAPLAGVAVAIFSEGPQKAEEAQEKREQRFGKEGLLGGGGGGAGKKSATGNERAARGEPRSSVSAHGPLGRVAGGIVSPTERSGEFAYHALNDEIVEERLPSGGMGGARGGAHGHLQAPAVVVPGEIARQSPAAPVQDGASAK